MYDTSKDIVFSLTQEVHVHKKRSRVAQVVVCAIVAASFLLLGLSKVRQNCRLV